MPGRARRVSQGPSVAAGTRRSGCAPSRCSVIAQRGGLNILGFLHTHKTAMVGNMLTPWGVVASFDRVYTSSSAPQCERKGTPGGHSYDQLGDLKNKQSTENRFLRSDSSEFFFSKAQSSAIMFRRLAPVAVLVLAALPTLEVKLCV